MTRPSEDAMYAQIDKALEHDPGLWRSMTYEQGVEAALRWVLGDAESPPMDEDG